MGRILKYIGLLVLLVVMADMVAGVLLIPKIALNIRTFHPYYHHGLKENQHGLENWTHTKKYEIFTNSIGCRDKSCRNVPLQPDKGVRRIVFIGDSFTEGVGVPYQKTFVGILGESLKKDNVEVLNAGVISYSAMTYYLRMKYLIENVGLKFDELYVFYDLSDVYNDYFHEKMERFVPHKEESFASKTRRQIMSFWDRHSYVVHSLNIIYPYFKYKEYERGFVWWTLNEEVFRKWAGEGLTISEGYMQKLVNLCKDHNIRLTIAVYPWTHLIENRDLDSRMVSFWESFTKRNHVDFINYFDDFINDVPVETVLNRYFLPNDIHWNEEGHSLIASEVMKARNAKHIDK